MAVLRTLSWSTALIRVTQQPEPAGFNTTVRVPGNLFLRRLRRAPTSDEWRKNGHWKYCLADLQTAYRDVCAFTACWVSDSASVDHFMAKSTHPNLAYEWSNYRLASQKVNSKKGNAVVLDPFTIDDAWFVLDFASSMVRPAKGLPTQVEAQVRNTITVLGLNDAGWVRVRFTVLRQYVLSHVAFEHLRQFYPFIARELERQALKDTIIGTMQ